MSALGRFRVLEVRPGVSEIWTLRGLDNQVLRRDNGNNYTDYIYRDGKLFGSSIPLVGNATRHFALDHLGSVRLIVNGQGAVLAEHTYFPSKRVWTRPKRSRTQHSKGPAESTIDRSRKSATPSTMSRGSSLRMCDSRGSCIGR